MSTSVLVHYSIHLIQHLTLDRCWSKSMWRTNQWPWYINRYWSTSDIPANLDKVLIFLHWNKKWNAILSINTKQMSTNSSGSHRFVYLTPLGNIYFKTILSSYLTIKWAAESSDLVSGRDETLELSSVQYLLEPTSTSFEASHSKPRMSCHPRSMF